MSASPEYGGVRVGLPRWSHSAWGAIGATTAFLALTCWWLTQDRSIPFPDAGYHLQTAIAYHSLLAAGHLLGPLRETWFIYPPLAPLVGALGMFVGGANQYSAVIAENVVFVSLLALGCYQTGRLLFGARAGLLAVIFALGSPLVIAQFHVFMLDAPETAVVALSLWLILASDDFRRVGFAGLAGLVVGCGMVVKVQFPFYVAGLVLALLVRGGWRHWRGLAWFAVMTLAAGAPWYFANHSVLVSNQNLSGVNPGTLAGNTPPLLSTASLSWYFWSILNSQLLVPLFVLAVGGTIWTIVAVARRRATSGLRLEFLAGLVVALLAITFTRHHDTRYGLPLIPYLAVIGTGWIVHLPREARFCATALLVLAVAANTLGTTFGLGRPVELALVSHPPVTGAFPDRVVLYSNQGFLVAGPQRDGDVPDS